MTTRLTKSSIDNIYFPYPNARPHQIIISEMLRKTLNAGKHAIFEAANGTGKTIPMLSEALDYVRRENKRRVDRRLKLEEALAGAQMANHPSGEDPRETEIKISKLKPLKIIYTARTNSQADRAIDELQEIDAKTNVLGYSKRGKRAMCINQAVLGESKSHGHFIANCEKITQQKKCLYLNNYYRKRQVKQDLIESLIVFPMTAEQVKEESTFSECYPAAVSNELLKRAEVIACSYLYMFDRELRISSSRRLI